VINGGALIVISFARVRERKKNVIFLKTKKSTKNIFKSVVKTSMSTC